jgi:hypothetical protein
MSGDPVSGLTMTSADRQSLHPMRAGPQHPVCCGQSGALSCRTMQHGKLMTERRDLDLESGSG